MRLALVLLALAGCHDERRLFHVAAPYSDRAPGPAPVAYDENAWAIAEGQRLYVWMNCHGCHGMGGGGMGPALMDDRWIYGAEPADIHRTITDGRPNGMPAFGDRLPDVEIWKLVAYVRSLAGLANRAAVAGRTDHMHARPPGPLYDPQEPRR